MTSGFEIVAYYSCILCCSDAYSVSVAVHLILVQQTVPQMRNAESSRNKGSDTMVNLAQAWAEEYTGISSTVSVEVSGGGSGTGVAALINGTVDIANCSRQIKPKEKQQAQKNTGKEPIEFIVGYDALAVYVHKDNPLDIITIPQLAEIYGEDGKITKWDQLGIANSGCRSDKIIRISRQSNSGTYFYFREALLGKEREF